MATYGYINNRNYWLQTDDDNYVVLVPSLADDDIMVLDCRDGDVPALEFDPVNTLKDETMTEAAEIAADSKLALTDVEHMAVTFRRD